MNIFSPISKARSVSIKPTTSFFFLSNSESVVVEEDFNIPSISLFFLRDSNSRVFVQFFLLSSIYRQKTRELIHAAIATSVFLGYFIAPFSTIQRQIWAATC